MAKTSPGITIAHLNIRGLLNKLDELKYHVHKLNIDILHVSETLLTSNTDSKLVNIPGYNMIRRDREGRRGGGVLSYIHNSINFSHLTNLCNTLSESISIIICQPKAKPFITSVVYRPPNSPVSWSHSFSDYISECNKLQDEIIVTGDFNIDLAQLTPSGLTLLTS